MAGSVHKYNDWGDYSEISDKDDVGYLDFEDDKSVYDNDLYPEDAVIISTPFPFINGNPQSALVGQITADSITILNTTCDSIDLWGVKIFSSNPKESFSLSLMKPPSSDSTVQEIESFYESSSLQDRMVQAGQTLEIWLLCKPKEIGLHNCIVHLDIGDERIERVAFLSVEDEVSQFLVSKKPYSRSSRSRKNFDCTNFVQGSYPVQTGKHSYKYLLPKYPIPMEVRELVKNNQLPDVLMEGLNVKNYSSYFSALINIEELHMEEEMKAYDMYNVSMKSKGNQFLVLEVPGLAEKRPSLICGDYIFASKAGGKPYQGYIHRVEAEVVYLKFMKEFHHHHHDHDIYDIRFTYNRINMRRLYQALEAAKNLGPEFLFPSLSNTNRVIRKKPIVPLNPTLNKEQLNAVEMILGCTGAPPYVIHGPPGTGKTMTIVETILQLYMYKKGSTILVCASSNSAADHILEKLIYSENAEVNNHDIFRLNAPSRLYDDVNPEYLCFCFFEDMVFRCPPISALQRYRIILCTYMSASLLYTVDISNRHFTHIFLDEAGQSTEPETMIPLSNLCRKQTVVVLAGDPMQLGPVVYSNDAEAHGLDVSYLERIFEHRFYQNKNVNYVTKLLRNYRCHPAILDLPSRLFYGKELISCKEEKDSWVYEWEDLPNKEFPIFFIGIQGINEREGNNPSWFNRTEASKVIEIIRKLKLITDLDKEDIGVITPYRQQVLKLKSVLERYDMNEVKVGTVEQFQGQERTVIIVSTVRSTIKHDEFDKIHNLGFLGQPRRFNVAITRAKMLLIIVGNPHILSKDPYWDELLRFCLDNSSYQGCPLPPPQERPSSDDTVQTDDLIQENPPLLDSNNVGGCSNWGDGSEPEPKPEPEPEPELDPLYEQYSHIPTSGWDD